MNEGGVEGVGVGEILAEITEENGLEGGYAMRERRGGGTIGNGRECGGERRIAVAENQFFAEQIEVVHDVYGQLGEKQRTVLRGGLVFAR